MHAIEIVYPVEPVHPNASVAEIVNVKLPPDVGVPESNPLWVSVSPGGSDPPDRAYVYGPFPPDATTDEV